MTALMLNRAHHPVTTLGPGIRAGIWTQGCTIGCRGCLAQDTWQSNPDRHVEVDAVVDWLGSLRPLDGITITGGEPFQQIPALTALLRAIRTSVDSAARTVDVLVYSGYTYAALCRRHGALDALSLCDAAITGPYIDRRNPGGPWRGSANQTLLVLSDLGRERFNNDDAIDDETSEARLQTSFDGDRMWLIGIPRHGDLPRLEQALAARGIEVGDASWRG